ncbi:cytochrome b5 reductase [Schizosaccharomyces japonicus yFS275]|uniref:Cytochrome b5 reductase n=1 Tax=Schizosaccharomyces japonicus (strain yFS275 / FY16936) TaxID=402676 RepID=B6K171_SCHJY|nr:cytochrome b5 reductase [Schizosaccharomyces japonicus yFS275]EEB07692.1 cytochrome b5 reductase [Schizosaccharomyces japonicus yFS275]
MGYLGRKLAVSNRLRSQREPVALAAGHSPLDWARLVASKQNLSGVPTIIKVSKEELAKHNKPDDCWMCIKGKVYNITPYLQFHPGGVGDLIDYAGQDATNKFMETHAWVNEEALLRNCLVGFLV